MSDMIPTPEQTPAPTPTAPAKNKGGRPRKDKLANTLAETLRQIDKLCEQDHPSNAKARLLQSKLEFYTAEQKFQREQIQERSELQRLRMQAVLDRTEIAILKKRIEGLTGENV